MRRGRNFRHEAIPSLNFTRRIVDRASSQPVTGDECANVEPRHWGCIAGDFDFELPLWGFSKVFTQARKTSATLQAWAMQPRGVNGGSASKISAIEPIQPSSKCVSNALRNFLAPSLSCGFTFSQQSTKGP